MGYTGVHVKHIANNGDITNLKWVVTTEKMIYIYILIYIYVQLYIHIPVTLWQMGVFENYVHTHMAIKIVDENWWKLRYGRYIHLVDGFIDTSTKQVFHQQKPSGHSGCVCQFGCSML